MLTRAFWYFFFQLGHIGIKVSQLGQIGKKAIYFINRFNTHPYLEGERGSAWKSCRGVFPILEKLISCNLLDVDFHLVEGL